MVQHPGGCYFALKEWSGELPSCKGSFAACMHVVFLVPLLAFVSLSSQGACEFFFVFFFRRVFHRASIPVPSITQGDPWGAKQGLGGETLGLVLTQQHVPCHARRPPVAA